MLLPVATSISSNKEPARVVLSWYIMKFGEKFSWKEITVGKFFDDLLISLRMRAYFVRGTKLASFFDNEKSEKSTDK